MLIKKKSLIVVLVSSFVIALVMVLTLVGYVAYMELKGEESRRNYQDSLRKINVRTYSGYIDVKDLNSKIEESGALRGKMVIEGIIKNNGSREIDSILIKVKFLDKDGAVIYEAIFHPQEPSLGTSGMVQLSIPYLSSPPKITVKPGSVFPFKTIVSSCPEEILSELRQKGTGKNTGKWSGKFGFEILALDFSG